MTKEEMQAALKEFKATLGEYVSPEDLATKLKDFEEKLPLDMSGDLAEIKTAVEKQGELLNLMKINQKQEPKTLKDELLAVKDALANAADKTVTIKTDITRASVVNSTIAMRLNDVGQLATQANRLAPLFAQGTVGTGMGGVVRYIDQTSVTNNAAAVLEAGVKPESAIAWAEYTLPLQKVAHNIPVTMEALTDLAFMESEINNMLLKYLDIKIDNYLWSGTGTAPQIKGIYVQADTYTATAQSITDANIFDLIVKVKEDIVGDTGYMPNYAIMNISDVNQMTLKKDSNNNYTRPPFVSEGETFNVAGITVIVSNSVTANTMLVGDFNFATLYKQGGTTLKVGLIDKQFVENMVTVQAEQRLALLCRNAHTDAFRKVASISASLTTLASDPA